MLPRRDSNTYDAAANTWTLRSHAAAREALACLALAAGHEPIGDDVESTAIQTGVRAAARDLFPAARLTALRATLEASARSLAATLPVNAPVDLMRDFATPWSLDLAFGATHTPIPADDRPRLTSLAHTIFLDAAQTRTGEISAPARDAASALASSLAARDSTHTIDVQSFVALSQTLPHLLVSAWHALLTHPEALHQWHSLHDKSNAIDELLRFAGPSRAVFRRARRDTQIGASFIERDQRVILLLSDANRDPLVFPDGDRLDLGRDASRHVAFGGGAHVCVGTPIIKLALEVATNALFNQAKSAMIEDVQWLDGFAIRAPSSLVTLLSS